MAEKKRLEYDDPEQSARFIELAKELGADESKEKLKEAMKRISSWKRKEFEKEPEAEKS